MTSFADRSVSIGRGEDLGGGGGGGDHNHDRITSSGDEPQPLPSSSSSSSSSSSGFGLHPCVIMSDIYPVDDDHGLGGPGAPHVQGKHGPGGALHVQGKASTKSAPTGTIPIPSAASTAAASTDANNTRTITVVPRPYDCEMFVVRPLWALDSISNYKAMAISKF